MHTVFVDSLRKQEITASHEKGSTSFSFSVLLFFCWGKYSFNIEKRKSLCWGTGFSLTIKKKKRDFWQDWNALLFYKCSLRHPHFSLGSGTLTVLSIHSSRKPVCSIYTHNWGERGRFHNEVQRFMAASIKMLSESRSHSLLWWSQPRYQG